MLSVTFAGSLDVLSKSVEGTVGPRSRVCVLGTAAAFQGSSESIGALVELEVWRGATVTGIEAIDRASANDSVLIAEVASADLVVLADGAALHARSVWRGSALGETLATSTLLAVGSVGSILGETMIDPRGGAPTTGLGFFDDVVISVPAGADQTQRTQDLLGGRYLWAQLGRRTVLRFQGTWCVVSGEDLMVTRARELADL